MEIKMNVKMKTRQVLNKPKLRLKTDKKEETIKPKEKAGE